MLEKSFYVPLKLCETTRTTDNPTNLSNFGQKEGRPKPPNLDCPDGTDLLNKCCLWSIFEIQHRFLKLNTFDAFFGNRWEGQNSAHTIAQ